MITNDTIEDFIDYLFDTIPFSQQIASGNRQGFKNILLKLLEDLYQEIPKDVLNYLNMNASTRFLDLLYREAGISDYHINRVPDNLKIRLSYLLNVLNINKATQSVFGLFHEALEEFYPKMNIYLIEIQPKDINAKNIELEYKLDPRYITDSDSIIEEITESELSGTFLMKPEQFLDREEKFSNIYTDYKSKQRIINIFPIKTGILYVQNPSGLGQTYFDNYIPLMQTIGASKEQNKLFPWKFNDDSKKRSVPFSDFIKLCTYLKYKEFAFKAKRLYSSTWTWSTVPLETYRDSTKLKNWEVANLLASENGTSWSTYYKYTQNRLNDFLLNEEDLEEAERLEVVYRGLKRSGTNNPRQELNQFKTDWNTLRQKSRNVSLRKVTDMKEFRDELIGTEPISLLEFELLLLNKFKKVSDGIVRDNIIELKKIYTTNEANTLDESTGLYTLLKKFFSTAELNNFIRLTYPNTIECSETQFKLDLLNYYTVLGTTPLLKNYNYIKSLKFPELVGILKDDQKYNNISVYNKVYNELMNNTNLSKFAELNNIIKVKYRSIVQQIDDMDTDETEVEDYTLVFLYLWKLIQADLSTDTRVKFFWNEFFMRFIMGSSFKDFIYDPIMDLFLEYWFPAEMTTQNKDIQTVLIKDKMQTIPIESRTTKYITKKLFSKIVTKDQNRITIYNPDGTVKETKENIHKVIKPKDLKIIIN